MAKNGQESAGSSVEHGSLGDELRSARELREVSLREISEATKISMRFLEAIESDDLRVLPAPVFTRGFLIEYARYIGLDPEDVAGRYMSIVQESRLREEEEDQRNRKQIGGSTLGAFEIGLLVGLVVAILATVTVYWIKSAPAQERPASVPASEAPIEPVEVDPPVVEQVELSTAPGPEEPFTMTIRANTDSWIVLWADGQKIMGDTLRAGEERTFQAERIFTFETLGNAGGVTITLDGELVPPLGRAGQVVQNRSFERPSSGGAP